MNICYDSFAHYSRLDFSFSDFSGSNGRRESQGSLSSGTSLELGTSGSGRNEVSLREVKAHGRYFNRKPFLSFPSSSPATVPPPAYLCFHRLLFLKPSAHGLFSRLRLRAMFPVAQYQCQQSAEAAAPPRGSVT